MTPIRKYEKYGRFPWKMVIHLLLVVLTTCQVVLVVNQGTTYAFSQYSLWNSLFINHNIQGSTSPIVNSFMLFSSKHVTSFVETSVKRYYDINSHTIDNYEFNYLDDGTKKPPKLLVRYLDNASSLNKGYLIEYNLLPNDFGPFSDNADNFLDEVSDFDIEFNLIHEVNTYVETASNCYDWKITQKFDYSSHGIVIASLDTYRKSCHSEPCNYIYSSCI